MTLTWVSFINIYLIMNFLYKKLKNVFLNDLVILNFVGFFIFYFYVS